NSLNGILPKNYFNQVLPYNPATDSSLANDPNNVLVRFATDDLKALWSLFGKHPYGYAELDMISDSVLIPAALRGTPFGTVQLDCGASALNDPQLFKRVLTHELGHLLGFGHTDDGYSLMSPTASNGPYHLPDRDVVMKAFDPQNNDSA